jgi:pyruvate formate lyase activating enzyme
MRSSALITNIQRYSIHDGPGIRTTVFFKGCNLRCPWCHNPETVKGEQELCYYAEKCVRCGACMQVCPAGAHFFTNGVHGLDRKRCTACGACAGVCYAGALVMAAELMSRDEILQAVLRDRDFYDASGGGVTFSGGEPLLQKDFLVPLLRACGEAGISTAIESALQVPEETLAELVPWTDLFLADFKHPRRGELIDAVGADLDRVTSNIAFLVRAGAETAVRIPVIPDFNDTEELIQESVRLLSSLGLRRVELLPFHNLAEGKYRSLGRIWQYAAVRPPAAARLEALRKTAGL